MRKVFFWVVCLSLCVVSIGYADTDASNDTPFPVYSTIQPNVAFWKKIYSEYHSRQGLIHDSVNLSVVYEVVNLVPVQSRRSRYVNRDRIKASKQKYASILKMLAIDLKAENDEERRVLDMFGPDVTASRLREAASSIRFQRGQKDRFINGVIRSGWYLVEIKRIFRENGLPEDLAYLPHVESSFNYNAYSKFGAAGIWQFTYGTGKRYMTVDYSVDERWDPLIASVAAAKFLKNNYAMLKSWPLALTAYNHGAKAMMRAKKEKGDYERIFLEYDGRRFKFASRNFYSEFLAARDIAKNHVQYFGNLDLNEPESTIAFQVEGFVAVEDIISHFGLTKDQLQHHNLSLRKPVFLGQKYIPKGFRLKIPQAEKVAELIEAFPSDLYKDAQKRSQFYYVRKGDVAGAIARRHGISLDDLIRANNLNRRATIYVGQNLRIPGPGDQALLASNTADQSAVEPTADEIRRREERVKAIEALGKIQSPSQINPLVVTGNFLVRRTFTRSGNQYGTIQVETGETLGHYAEWLQVSAQTIRNLNNLSFSQPIHMGQTLVMPMVNVSKELFEERRYEYHKEFEEDFLGAYKIENVTTYTIQRGDNIWNVCTEKLRLPVWLVKKYNYGVNLSRLMPGQKIIVPVIEVDEENESYEVAE